VSAAKVLAEGRGAAVPRAAWICWALTSGVWATRPAAPTAAPFKKPRRLIPRLFESFIDCLLVSRLRRARKILDEWFLRSSQTKAGRYFLSTKGNTHHGLDGGGD